MDPVSAERWREAQAWELRFWDRQSVPDHVRDPVACVREAARITAPGGWFVFGQDLTEAGDTAPTNPGHPFMISTAFVEPLLRRWFAEEYRRVAPREEIHEPAMHSEALAFMGRRSRREPV